MVLPLVSLVGWLQGQLFEDPGGSNPLLELVLNGHNVPALACFGVTAIVMAPLFEETIFRGVLMPVAARYWGSSWGIVASAAVFAVAHSSLGEFPPLMVLGLGLGWLRWRSGRLGSFQHSQRKWTCPKTEVTSKCKKGNNITRQKSSHIQSFPSIVSPRVVQKLNDAIKLAAQLGDQNAENKTTSKVLWC